MEDIYPIMMGVGSSSTVYLYSVENDKLVRLPIRGLIVPDPGIHYKAKENRK